MLKNNRAEVAIVAIAAYMAVCIGAGFISTAKTNWQKIKDAHNAPITVDK